jgi:hypothetical protein
MKGHIIAFILVVLQKSGEILLELVLAKFLEWVLKEDRLNRVTIALKLKILVFVLNWLLQNTRL